MNNARFESEPVLPPVPTAEYVEEQDGTYIKLSNGDILGPYSTANQAELAHQNYNFYFEYYGESPFD